MMAMVEQKCRCGVVFKARRADVNRGWGKFCSKSCKANEQERRTGQYAALKRRQVRRSFEREFGGTAVFERNGRYEGFVFTGGDFGE